MKSPTEHLLAEVLKFLRTTGISPTAFGSQAVGDPNLINDLQAGRELRHRTMLRVRAFMSSRDHERKSA